MGVCVCLSGADGRVVEGRDTLPTPLRGRQGSNPGRMGFPWMLCAVVFVLCRPEKGDERGWAWVAGESTPEPRRTTGKNGRTHIAVAVKGIVNPILKLPSEKCLPVPVCRDNSCKQPFFKNTHYPCRITFNFGKKLK
jgi:hypothetical protein